MRTVRVVVRGRVQRVGYRRFAEVSAQSFGLVGWVRNRADSSVEVCCQGDVSSIDAFLKVLRQGPPMADVEAVEVFDENPQQQFDSFEIRPTA